MQKAITRLIPILVVLVVLTLDQASKFWIKTHMSLSEEISVIGDWFILHFTENNGMAFGLEFIGKYGKITLTLFRIVAVAGIIWYLISQIRKKAPTAFIVSISLILAGAIGNIIDSVFYGVIFSDINNYPGGFLHGKVVDMLYFPLVNTYYPEWFPFWGGEELVFFRPVFNIADAAISIGVFIILIFQKKFFGHMEATAEQPEKQEENETGNDAKPDSQVIS